MNNIPTLMVKISEVDAEKKPEELKILLKDMFNAYPKEDVLEALASVYIVAMGVCNFYADKYQSLKL